MFYGIHSFYSYLYAWSSFFPVVYTTFFIIGLILSMQVPFVGFQPLRTSEHMAAIGKVLFGAWSLNSLVKICGFIWFITCVPYIGWMNSLAYFTLVFSLPFSSFSVNDTLKVMISSTSLIDSLWATFSLSVDTPLLSRSLASSVM